MSIHRVRGDSMSPSLCDGDFIVSFKGRLRRYKVDDIVVVQHSLYGVIVKRIKEVYPTDSFALIGDNPTSTSTEQMGTIEKNAIIGRVVLHIRRPHLPARNAP
nr:S24/S26 family peptidase [Neptunomonas sp. XY-337]